jgi:hypothetical protein
MNLALQLKQLADVASTRTRLEVEEAQKLQQESASVEAKDSTEPEKF